MSTSPSRDKDVRSLGTLYADGLVFDRHAADKRLYLVPVPGRLKPNITPSTGCMYVVNIENGTMPHNASTEGHTNNPKWVGILSPVDEADEYRAVLWKSDQTDCMGGFGKSTNNSGYSFGDGTAVEPDVAGTSDVSVQLSTAYTGRNRQASPLQHVARAPGGTDEPVLPGVADLQQKVIQLQAQLDARHESAVRRVADTKTSSDQLQNQVVACGLQVHVKNDDQERDASRIQEPDRQAIKLETRSKIIVSSCDRRNSMRPRTHVRPAAVSVKIDVKQAPVHAPAQATPSGPGDDTPAREPASTTECISSIVSAPGVKIQTTATRTSARSPENPNTATSILHGRTTQGTAPSAQQHQEGEKENKKVVDSDDSAPEKSPGDSTSSVRVHLYTSDYHLFSRSGKKITVAPLYPENVNMSGQLAEHVNKVGIDNNVVPVFDGIAFVDASGVAHYVYARGDPESWPKSDIQNGKVKDVVATAHAVCVVYETGSVETWGEDEYGGALPEELSEVEFESVCANDGSFAAIGKRTGTIYTWGEGGAFSGSAGDELGYSAEFEDCVFERIVTTDQAFAAMYTNTTDKRRSVCIWGTYRNPVTIQDVYQAFPSHSGFVFLCGEKGHEIQVCGSTNDKNDSRFTWTAGGRIFNVIWRDGVLVVITATGDCFIRAPTASEFTKCQKNVIGKKVYVSAYGVVTIDQSGCVEWVQRFEDDSKLLADYVVGVYDDTFKLLPKDTTRGIYSTVRRQGGDVNFFYASASTSDNANQYEMVEKYEMVPVE